MYHLSMASDSIEIPPDLHAWLDQQAITRGLPVSTLLLGILYDAKNADDAARLEEARVNRPPDVWSGIENELRRRNQSR